MLSNRSDPPPAGPVAPLAMLRCGESGQVIDVRGGRGPMRRLADMGFARGVPVTVVSDAGSSGPLVVRVGQTKIGIGRRMAMRIMVRRA